MGKLLKTKAALAGLIVYAGAAQSAMAQSTSNSQLLETGLSEKFSAEDISSMMSEFEIQTVLTPYAGDEAATLVALTSGGGQFIISMFQCEDVTVGKNCNGAVIYTAMSNSGVAYDDINAFNSDSDVTKAVNMGDENLILYGTQIFFGGGVGRENYKLVTALFLTDLQRYIEAQVAAGVSVSFQATPSSTDKLTNSPTIDGETRFLNATPISVSHDLVRATAIANTWHVEFKPEGFTPPGGKP